jgi:hypothetical protein
MPFFSQITFARQNHQLLLGFFSHHPSISSGVEISCHFPPTSQPQDVSVLGIGSTVTAMDLSLSTLHATACLKSCSQLYNFESSANAGDRAEMDFVVVHEKEAINCCRRVLKYSVCMAKRENLVPLVIMTEKIVNVCRRIVILCHMKENNRDVITKDVSISSSSASSVSNHSTPSDLIMNAS